MPEFQIFSDGSCDIPLEALENLQIKTIPFYVSLQENIYTKELYELPIDDFFHSMIKDKIYPKTSLPSVQDYINAFTPVLEAGKDILCFTITDTLSGSYQSAASAKQIVEESFSDAKIYIVNSWLATGALMLLLMEARKMQQAGFSIDEVLEKAEKLKTTARILFMVGGLDYLQHGGRIGKIASLSGKLLNIKPLIELANGEISVAGVSQSRKKGLKKLSAAAMAHFQLIDNDPKDYSFLIGTTNTWDETDTFQEMLQSVLPESIFFAPFQIGATIASHTGPDTIGVCFIKKYETI